MVLFGQHLTAITFTAMAGGILTSLVIWLLARRNGIDTFRLIIIGIGVRAMLMAFNTAVTAGLAGHRDLRRAVVCRFTQRPDVGQNLARRTVDFADVYRRAAAGAPHAAAGDGRRQRLRAGRER